ncbi:hypothetical protein DRN44_00885 [Thermococci archaeon]|nr:MAG: hypothetical protein DRN44_00885 [Thermococci archaeon]
MPSPIQICCFICLFSGQKREYKVIVDDNLDTFYTFKTTLDLLGLDTRILEDILVVNYSSLTQGAS